MTREFLLGLSVQASVWGLGLQPVPELVPGFAQELERLALEPVPVPGQALELRLRGLALEWALGLGLRVRVSH